MRISICFRKLLSLRTLIKVIPCTGSHVQPAGFCFASSGVQLAYMWHNIRLRIGNYEIASSRIYHSEYTGKIARDKDNNMLLTAQ